MKVVFLMGSKVDMSFAQNMADDLMKWGVPSELIVASAHKVPEKVFQIVSENNKSEEEIVYITIAGRSNGLSGVTGANSIHPVIACPPFADKDDFIVNINSTLMMPGDTPVLTVIDPGNAVLCAVRIFALNNSELKSKLESHLAEVKASFN